MAFTSVPTVATGDTWTASQHNTYLRDNMAALFPYTTTGDIAVASSASTLTRVARPSTRPGIFTMTTAGVGAWVEPETYKTIRYNGTALAADYAVPNVSVYNTTNFPGLAGGVDNILTFNTDLTDTDNYHSTSSNTSRLTAASAANFVNVFWQIACTRDSGGGSAAPVTLEGKVLRSGSTVLGRSMLVLPESIGGGLTFYVTGCTSVVNIPATQYIELSFYHTDSATWQVTGGIYETMFGMIRVA